MKSLKFKIAILALACGITSAFAFKPAPVVNSFWKYANTLKSPTDPTAYVQSTNTCDEHGDLCGIDAPANPSHPAQPTISMALQGRINSLDTSAGDVHLQD
ncbi:hypothetical protein [Mucilaginibacter sp.]|jgi:hypothetical protein|uniref:hypothetical protein n=1 Tax=Mucilaginibacter sp. TaxID=1882438 RepID=UPI002CC905C7|nr:hypothetical protein [Mucilaginibacter sp.]HTI58991.1 hypothetical protein [Mucilaginibacter sp.]